MLANREFIYCGFIKSSKPIDCKTQLFYALIKKNTANTKFSYYLEVSYYT